MTVNEPEPQRVLIARSSHLGDVAQTIVLVHALRARWPALRIAWAVEPPFAPLVAPLVDAIVPFARDGGLGAWPRIRREMRNFGPDLAIDAQGNWKSAMVVVLSGARRKIGFARDRWQEPAAARLLPIDCQGGAAGLHLVDRLLALASALTGAEVEPRLDTRLDPGLTGEEASEGRARLAELLRGAARDARPAILHPGGEGDPRTWPKEYHLELAGRLAEHRAWRPIILTGPAEAGVGEWLRLQSGSSAIVHLVGQRGLRALAALLAAAAERGGCLLAQDSGPAHVAASVGLPVHLLAGPEDPSRTGPWPVAGAPASPHAVVAAPAQWRSGAPWGARPIHSVSVDAAEASIVCGDRDQRPDGS